MRLEAFIVRRAFALKFFTLFRFSFVGYLQNFDNACLRCFMASLHSSLYHGLLFFGFVEVFGILLFLIVLGFNDTSTLEGHFVSSPREREKRDKRESRGDEREGQGRKRNRNESEETEEIKTFPLYPYPLQG